MNYCSFARIACFGSGLRRMSWDTETTHGIIGKAESKSHSIFYCTKAFSWPRGLEEDHITGTKLVFPETLLLSPSLIPNDWRLLLTEQLAWEIEGNQGPIRSLIYQIDRILILTVCFLLFHPVYILNNPSNGESITSLEEITHSLLKISHQYNFNSSQPTLSLFLILCYCSQQPFVACFSRHSQHAFFMCACILLYPLAV